MRISVMGGGAANVLLTVKRDQNATRSQTLMTPEEQEAFKAPILETYEAREAPTTPPPACGMTASSTRPGQGQVLALALSACLNAPVTETQYRVFRM